MSEVQFHPQYEDDYFVAVNGAEEFDHNTHAVEIFRVDRFGKRTKVLQVHDAGGYLVVEDHQ